MMGFTREDLILLLVSFLIALALWFNVTLGKKDEGKQILPFTPKPGQTNQQGSLLPMSNSYSCQNGSRDRGNQLIFKI